MQLTIWSCIVHDKVGLETRPGICKILQLQPPAYFFCIGNILKHGFEHLDKLLQEFIFIWTQPMLVSITCLFSQGFPETQNKQGVQIYCKELAHILKEADKSVNMNLVFCRPGESMVQLVLIPMQANPMPQLMHRQEKFQLADCFVQCRTCSDWIRPMQEGQGILGLFSSLTQLLILSYPETLLKTHLTKCLCGLVPSQVIDKINHCR